MGVVHNLFSLTQQYSARITRCATYLHLYKIASNLSIMVFYNDHDTSSGRAMDRRNKYWKLGPQRYEGCESIKRYLSKHNFDYMDKTCKARLIELMGRCQRGMPSYERMIAKKLRDMAKDRGLQVPSKTKKPQVVQMLERADDNFSLDGFLELPAEMKKHGIHGLLRLAPRST